MSQPEFNEAEWIENLGTALAALAGNDCEYTIRESRRVKRPLSFGQSQVLAQLAEKDHTAQETFRELHVKLNRFPTKAMEILISHPVICHALPNPSEDGMVQCVLADEWYDFLLSDLVSKTMKSVLKVGGRESALILNRFLTLGESRQLRGFEITSFQGVECKGPLYIGEDAYFAPYDDAKAAYSLPEYEGASSRSLLDSKSTLATVFIREFSWGITVGPPTRDGEPIVRPQYPFLVSYESIIDLLSIATGKSLAAPHQYIRTDGSLENLSLGINKIYSDGGRLTAKHVLSDEDLETFTELFCGWQVFNQKRDAVELAIMRLAGSLSRRDRFDVEDMILDTATALEIMYELDGSEIGHKLAIRAAWFLGANPDERSSILKSVRKFYAIRSAIVHSGKAKQSRREVSSAFSDGFDLSRSTVRKLLRDGRPSDWDELVVAGEHLQLDS